MKTEVYNFLNELNDSDNMEVIMEGNTVDLNLAVSAIIEELNLYSTELSEIESELVPMVTSWCEENSFLYF